MKADSRYYRIARGQEKPKNAVDGFIYRFWLNNFASPSKIWFYTGEQIAHGLTRCLGPSVAETIETMDAFNKKILEELERGYNAD